MEDNSLSVKVEVPVNATATLIVPDNFQGISESGNPVWDNAGFQSADGVSGIQKKEGKVSIELASGSYSFLMN